MRFFKIISTTMVEDGKIRIPEGFTKEHGANMSNPVSLKTPDDRQWSISWTKTDKSIWFEKGWKEFSTYYTLDHGHLLLFEYDEKTTHFVVHIFDKSTLEIEYLVHGSQDEQNNVDQIRKKSAEPSNKKTRSNSQICSPQPHKKLRTCEEDGGGSSKSQNLPKLVSIKEEAESEPESDSEPDAEELTHKISELSNKARNFKSKNPFFVLDMKSSYVGKYMYVPLDFAQENFSQKQFEIVLEDSDENTWSAKYCNRRIGTGWKKFSLEKNLKVGDVCRFELIKNQALKVEIFRLGEEPESLTPQDSVQGNNVLDSESETVMSSREGEASKGNSLQPSRRRALKNDEMLIDVKKFTSTLKNPFFTVTMKTRNMKAYKPRVNKSFFVEHFNLPQQTVTLQCESKMWEVNLLCFEYEPAARFGKGHGLFAEENKLQVGDACVFELINKEDAVFDVHIFRRPN